MFHDQGGCSHSLGKHRGIKKRKIKTSFLSALTLGSLPVNSHNILSVKPLQSLTAGRAEQRLWAGLELWPSHGQHLEWQTLGRTCCAPPELHRHRAASLVTEFPETLNWGAQHGCKSTSPSTGVQECTEMKRLWCISNVAVTARLLPFCLQP